MYSQFDYRGTMYHWGMHVKFSLVARRSTPTCMINYHKITGSTFKCFRLIA